MSLIIAGLIVPQEVVMLIAQWAHEGSYIDQVTLHSLSMLSWAFNMLMRDHRNAIISHYMVKQTDVLSTVYRLCGKLHNINDQPAIIYNSGTQVYYRHGKRHRDNNKPALVRFDGQLEWYIHGEPVSAPIGYYND